MLDVSRHLTWTDPNFGRENRPLNQILIDQVDLIMQVAVTLLFCRKAKINTYKLLLIERVSIEKM